MLTALKIDSFQSLHEARIPLGAFTVVAGPSNSGKSAVLRALRLLAANATGTGYISTGAKTAAVTVKDSDGTVVAIRRSRPGSRTPDAYVLAPPGQERQVFTKLNRQVPEQVAAVLRLGQVNFAGQHDMPYLLDETGSRVAMVLGELTNVSLVLTAATEAGRRRKEADRGLKDAVARRDALKEQVQAFRGLGDRRRAVEAAEAGLAVIAGLRLRAEGLSRLIQAAGAAEAELGRARSAVREVPSLERLDQLDDRQARLAELIQTAENLEASLPVHAGRVHAAEQAEADAHEALHAALVAAGECPLCGQAVR
jgi:DNA repair ATPase RecN